MSKAPDLLHEVAVAPDGACHVQDVHRFSLGQHRVYGAAAYARWRRSVTGGVPVEERQAACDCGLAPGQVREFTGTTWVDPKIAERGDPAPPPPAEPPKATPRAETPTKAEAAPPAEGAGKRRKAKRKEADMAKAKAKAKVSGRPAKRKVGSAAARRAWAARRTKYGKSGLSSAALDRRGARSASAAEPATPASP